MCFLIMIQDSSSILFVLELSSNCFDLHSAEEEGMKFPLMLYLLSSSLYLATTTTLPISFSKPGCQEKCGKVTVPYPFGIGSNCSANPSFTVRCQNSSRPFLSSINIEAVNISLLGTVVVKLPVSPMNCSGVQKTGYLLKGSPFNISARYNSMAVLGCKNSVWLRANETTTVGGCTAMCIDNLTESSCDGVNCCQAAIPPGLKEVEYTYKSTDVSYNSATCGFASPVDKKWLRKNYKSYKGLLNMSNLESGFAQVVLEWEFEFKDYGGICTYPDDNCLLNPTSFRCLLLYNSRSYYFSSQYYHDRYSYYNDDERDYVSSMKYCSCSRGYEGNPYLGKEGCKDIDECKNSTLNNCPSYATCINLPGYFDCQYPDYNSRSGLSQFKIASISIGSGLGALILLLVAWRLIKGIRKRIKANRKHKFFKRNGGLLLEQQLVATDNGLEKTMLFSSKVLTRATDQFNENRILGHGGQGTVYKGMLTDGRIVAVKKSKRIEEGDLEVFTNEVVILSQVNHRNIVKLLGCCLETEVPLLVYEFVPNGTLFHHIHQPSEEFRLTWEMRMRIAKEAADALAYLHSAASAPIYHRDIKSTNILLDDKYRAKVSDFGTSRSIAIDQTHLTTRVLGTFGYLDPEYFQSNQFTEKSDVYSFGVVMVELLTGEKAISSIRAEVGRSLATFFLHSMEENQLFDILDARVLKEGKREEIVAVAHLARRCLHLNGKRRPTMKAVAAELEAIQEVKECSYVVQNGDDSRVCHPIEIAESHNFSSISGSMPFDSIAPFSLESEHPLLGEP